MVLATLPPISSQFYWQRSFTCLRPDLVVNLWTSQINLASEASLHTMRAHQASNLLPASTAQQARVRERRKSLEVTTFAPPPPPPEQKSLQKQDVCSKRQLSYGRLLQQCPPTTSKSMDFCGTCKASNASEASLHTVCEHSEHGEHSAAGRDPRAKRAKTKSWFRLSLPPPPSSFGKKGLSTTFCAFNAAERGQTILRPSVFIERTTLHRK